jgi:hypothetical protein
MYDPANQTWSNMGGDWSGAFDNVTALAQLADGRIVAGGYSESIVDPDFAA